MPPTFSKPEPITFEALKFAVEPYIRDYHWAKDTLWDLWCMGAPAPQDPTKRILLPSMFKKWWSDVAARMGLPSAN